MQTFTHASHANAVVRKHGFPDGVMQILCDVARCTGHARATATADECGMQLAVLWHPGDKAFMCWVFDGRLAGGKQLERFNIR